MSYIFTGTAADSTDLSIIDLILSYFTVDFLLFTILYYAYYIFVVGIVTSVAVFVFQVDYTNIEPKQLRREVLLTLESYTTTAVCYWVILQLFAPNWSTDFNVVQIAASYLLNNICFGSWFYLSHKVWHSNRWLYKVVHAHHHESVIVCPFTALSNAWPESVWTSFGFAMAPALFLYFGFPQYNNLWGWYLQSFSIIGEAIIGHSRMPFTLEHASHHAVVNKNYGFYAETTGRLQWDQWFGTWVNAHEVPRIKKLYPKEAEYELRWRMGNDRNKTTKTKKTAKAKGLPTHVGKNDDSKEENAKRVYFSKRASRGVAERVGKSPGPLPGLVSMGNDDGDEYEA